jgi:NAD(P)-dependent dehydrogenase (short-subunit alcohol dehydrogenase family)
MPLSIVTGATGGLGYAVAKGLAKAGHHVVLTGRSQQHGADALARLRGEVPGAELEFQLCDVGSLQAVAGFAASWAERPVDVLVNNAGVMGFPERQLTADGFERQLGTNYLGHFALTLRLLPALLRTEQPRVVSVSSLAHRSGQIAFDDLQFERSYDPMRAYRQSKLAMLMFARELQRRAEERGWKLLSIAAHPGWSATRIVLNGMGQGLRERFIQAGFNFIAQSADAGAMPMLHAALAADVQPGGYYGPSRFDERRGPVAPSKVMGQARDDEAAARLWAVSEQLTGVTLPSAADAVR